MALGLSEATLVAIFLESILFGGFSILFAATLYTLYQKKSLSNTLTICSVCITMYILALIHITVNLQRVFEGFTSTTFQNGNSDTFFADIRTTSYITKVAVYEAQTVLGDGFMIYRLYVVWRKDKRILIPGVIWMLGSTSLAIYGVVSLCQLTSIASIFAMRIKNIGLSFYSITLGVNLICTAMIAYRIWKMERQMSEGAYRSRNLSAVLVSIIESGAIYSAWLIILIATFATNSLAYYPIFDALPSLIGIVFTLIIVRVALGLSAASESTSNISSHVYSQRPHHRPGTPIVPISVQMTSFRTTQNDAGDPVDVVIDRDRGSTSSGHVEYKSFVYTS